uniref:Ribonuclease HII n=1 Tax=viral metagenome TaxID=1070528 RepID=A0A6C0EXR5_9ZZZZ
MSSKSVKGISTTSKHILKISHFRIDGDGDSDSDGDGDSDGKNDYSKPFIEIGVDEAGRGPMFGRVYVGAVVLPKDSKLFDFSKMKDSKKFHSEKKIKEAAEYIKSHAIAWSVKYAEHTEIDQVNIRRATIDCMHQAINEIMEKMNTSADKLYLLIDGNDFIPMMKLCYGSSGGGGESYIQIPHICVESGDNTYASIAAASILAKVSRDDYIGEMCKEYPELVEKYDLGNNKGYGTKKHMDGIREHGISKWHRRSFGLCKDFA